MPSWERTARLADLSDRMAVRAERGGHALCLSLAGGSPVAVADVCAHRSTALSGGLLRDVILTCPGHAARRGPAGSTPATGIVGRGEPGSLVGSVRA